VAAALGLSRPIKHKCVDLLILLELARSAARYAASVSSAPVTKEDLYTAAALAGAYCSAAFFTVAAESIQIHGGIGFYLGARRAHVLPSRESIRGHVRYAARAPGLPCVPAWPFNQTRAGTAHCGRASWAAAALTSDTRAAHSEDGTAQLGS
jgi:hypothetical protein